MEIESVYQACLLDELKPVDIMIPLYKEQLLSYLTTAKPKELLINYEPTPKSGNNNYYLAKARYISNLHCHGLKAVAIEKQIVTGL